MGVGHAIWVGGGGGEGWEEEGCGTADAGAELWEENVEGEDEGCGMVKRTRGFVWKL